MTAGAMGGTRNRTGPRLAVGTLLAGLVFALVSALAPAARADEPATDAKAAAFEVDFLTGMIDHHQMAIMMAEPCVDKAVHEDLSALCQSIVQTQSEEVARMQAWLTDWYGLRHEPEMTTGDMRSMKHLERLSGEDYEIAFTRAMIRHHWAAVRESEKCLANAEHAELLALCRSIHDAQFEEIATMQSWLAQWYDRAGGRPARSA